MLNFKAFRAAPCVLAGVELMHMISKGLFAIEGADAMSFANQFYALAGKVRPVCGAMCHTRKIMPFDQQRDRTCTSRLIDHTKPDLLPVEPRTTSSAGKVIRGEPVSLPSIMASSVVTADRAIC